jgi:hypothetical protein
MYGVWRETCTLARGRQKHMYHMRSIPSMFAHVSFWHDRREDAQRSEELRAGKRTVAPDVQAHTTTARHMAASQARMHVKATGSAANGGFSSCKKT